MIEQRVARILPPELGVDERRDIKLEGPTIAIYVRNREYLAQHWDLIGKIAKDLKKRIAIRSPPDKRMNEKELVKAVRTIVQEIVGSDLVDDIRPFEEGDVVIYLRRPIYERVAKQIAKRVFLETGWRALIRVGIVELGMDLPTDEVRTVMTLDKDPSLHRERLSMLYRLGRRIHVENYPIKEGPITVEFLGAASEVGRSAVLVRTGESTVLLDCGLKPGRNGEELPLLDMIDVDELDAVVITHAHMDHIGCLPLLFKYGYRGPVYVTEPTKYLAYILLTDYVDVKERSGEDPLYTRSDVADAINHMITVDYQEVTDIAPDIKLNLFDAGHEVGSAIVHMNIGNGRYNIVYTGDFKYGLTRLHRKAQNDFKRVELLIMESTYGGKDDVQPPRSESEARLVRVIRETFDKGGKVLIPAFSTGRAQEILLILNEAILSGQLPKSTRIYVDGMILETLHVHIMFPEYLNPRVGKQILEGENPFTSSGAVEVVKRAKSIEARIDQVQQIVRGDEPSIIIAPHGMLNGGPALDYFAAMANDPRNSLIFVSYQAEGTLGRRILEGETEFVIRSTLGEDKVRLQMRVEHIPGFSGHSDRRELLSFIKNMQAKPQKVAVVHGEPSKVLNLGVTIELKLKYTTIIPKVGERIRLL